MGHSSPFVSSCTRRQWARRRSSRSRRSWVSTGMHLAVVVLVLAGGVAAVVAGRGGL